MGGFLNSLPNDTTAPAYDAAVLASLPSVNSIPFTAVTSDYQGHHGEFLVTTDALSIEGVRISVSAALQQTIADRLGCLLLTAKLADLVWLQRGVTLLPQPQSITSSSPGMIKESRLIDAALSQAGPSASPLIQTVGKHWILDNDTLSHPGKACNYGWHFPGGSFAGSKWGAAVTPGLRLIQDRGWFHDINHKDYSQTCCLVHRSCKIDGATRDLAEVYGNPQLAPLVSHQGALSVLRQPGVPLTACPLGGRPQSLMMKQGAPCPMPSLNPPALVSAAKEPASTWMLAGGLLIVASAVAWYLAKKT